MTSTGRRVIVGVDTHRDVHVAAVIDAATGQLLDRASFETRPDGYAALVRWLSNGQPRYTMHLSADAQPAALDHLLADHATPLP